MIYQESTKNKYVIAHTKKKQCKYLAQAINLGKLWSSYKQMCDSYDGGKPNQKILYWILEKIKKEREYLVLDS